MSLTPAQTAMLHAALDWITGVEQPDGAIITHHGRISPDADGLRFDICNAHMTVLVIVQRSKVEWDKSRVEWVLANPLTEQEMTDAETALTDWLAGTGTVVDRWNGAGCESGSLLTNRRAHPSLAAALARYRANCPEHGHPFCGSKISATSPGEADCRWWADGRALLVEPVWPVA